MLTKTNLGVNKKVENDSILKLKTQFLAMQTIRIFGIISSFVIVFGCSKESVVQDPISKTTPLLKQFVEIDTTLTSREDTLIKVEFKYDNNNRIKQINAFNFSISRTKAATTATFFYNSNDTLPWLRFVEMPLAGYASSLDSTFLFYNSIGNIVEDSSRVFYPNLGAHYMWLTLYYYDGNRVMRSDFGTTLSTIDNTFDADSNLVYSFLKDNNNIIVEQTFRYDNHPNPFNSMNIGDYIIYGDNYGLVNFMRQGAKNNFLFIDYHYTDHSANMDHKNTFSYVYNENGFPKQVIFYEVDNNGVSKYLKTGLYSY